MSHLHILNYTGQAKHQSFVFNKQESMATAHTCFNPTFYGQMNHSGGTRKFKMRGKQTSI